MCYQSPNTPFWKRRKKLYDSSWDIKKAFDSVSKAVIRLAWARLCVPAELIEWLVELDMNAWVAVRTLWTVQVWATQGLAGFNSGMAGESPFTFNPERGTGQGDISSSHTWVAVFDILLRDPGRGHLRPLSVGQHMRWDVRGPGRWFRKRPHLPYGLAIEAARQGWHGFSLFPAT